jgi:hypothetical protein
MAGEGKVAMDKELQELLDRARGVELTPDELEEHRIALAAANGHLSDSRITLETMRAARTIMIAAEKPKDDEAA